MSNNIKNILIKIKIGIIFFFNNFWFGINKKKICKIVDYKDKYVDKACFIIGNGPSLLASDLDRIKELNIVTFASNRIYNIFKSTDWRPTYYCVSDDGLSNDKEIFEHVEIMQPKMFFGKSQFSFAQRNLKCNHSSIYCEVSRKYLDNPKFSLDLNDRLYDIATVTYFMIQIAVYMGFKDIYLLGMDNKYKFGMARDGKVVRNEGVCNYFGEEAKEEPLPMTAPATWEMDVAYEYAEKFSREHGFRIYNATRGGFLEKFERVNIDDVLSSLDKK